jgi:NADPH:quinone reductase-like Zn-dependent oxidoreductase
MKTPERLARLKKYIYASLVDRTFTPNIDREFKFEDVGAAYSYFESSTQVGKIIVVLPKP